MLWRGVDDPRCAHVRRAALVSAAAALLLGGCAGAGMPHAGAGTAHAAAGTPHAGAGTPHAAAGTPHTGAGTPHTGAAAALTQPARIPAAGAESQYANVISQIGGRYVTATAIMSNPDADPHSFEASPSVARTLEDARLIVQNGAGYDTFMQKIEGATPRKGRIVLDVRRLLGLPRSLPNPHLWYSPRTMPTLAAALARALTRLEPSHARYFATRARRFDASLHPWLSALRRLRLRYPHAAVATSEPVADYLLAAAGTTNLTPWPLQADIMNGVDPPAQDITAQENLLNGDRVRAFVYNRQVTDSATQTFEAIARRAGVPTVGVYETMPRGSSYQRWMLAQTHALARALAGRRSRGGRALASRGSRGRRALAGGPTERAR